MPQERWEWWLASCLAALLLLVLSLALLLPLRRDTASFKSSSIIVLQRTVIADFLVPTSATIQSREAGAVSPSPAAATPPEPAVAATGVAAEYPVVVTLQSSNGQVITLPSTFTSAEPAVSVTPVRPALQISEDEGGSSPQPQTPAPRR